MTQPLTAVPRCRGRDLRPGAVEHPLGPGPADPPDIDG